MDPTDQRAEVTGPDASRAGRREWIGLAVLALACLLYAMDLTVLHLAVPSLSAELQPSSVELLWITDIYGFMVAGFLITMGTLGDRIGRRRLLLVGAAAFGVVSILAALSTSPGQLIVARALLGIAGATLAPSTLSLIFSMFQDPRSAPGPSGCGSPHSRPAGRSARSWAGCCWNASGGARCSCWRYR
jgi:MFS transporter, DHA2 family, multidrug resistance protein